MNADVVLPNLGFGMEEGRLIAWLKRPGDVVKKGEAIVEVESDKASVELDATVDGVLVEALFSADQMIPIGSVIARIQVGGVAAQESVLPQPATVPATPLAKKIAEAHGVNLSTVKGSGFGGRIIRDDVAPHTGRNGESASKPGSARPLAAPAVRMRARSLNIDLHEVSPTGSMGQVTHADLDAYLQRVQPSETVVSVQTPIVQSDVESSGRREIPLSAMRKAIARRLRQSAQEAPHFYVTAELDLTHAITLLPPEIGINNLLLFLTVQTLKELPDLNATYENDHLYQYEPIGLAVAVALPTGLITPVLHHAEDYSLSGLAARARDLIKRARDNKLKPDEMSGGTFTVSNLGIIKQVDHFTAIINPPQVAILAIGTAKPRPVVIDGGLHIRTTVHLSLSADHRVIDGLIAARFMEAFDNRLQNFSI